jgi:hypothetical protein
LADRIAEREPGNKPQSNDRIPYVYVVVPGQKLLQGERIETPTFIRENNLVPDYGFYITNQIMKPLLQMYALVVEKLPGYDLLYKKNHLKMVLENIKTEFSDNEDKVEDKMQTFKEYIVKTLLFDPIISQLSDVKIKKSLIGKKYNSVQEDGTLPEKPVKAVKAKRVPKVKVTEGVEPKPKRKYTKKSATLVI